MGTFVLLAQALLYFSVMTLLFHSRRRLGIGVFVCALGVMHFLETYLAAVFFIELPFGLISPGSTVMFSGKLAMILLLYIREDAETVRQPIYGLLIGNMLMVALAFILRFYTPVPMNGYNPDLNLLDQLGALMVWGTALLFVDSLGLIMIYERLGRLFGSHPVMRASIALILVLTFDQLMFYQGLRIISGAPPSALLGGWLAKSGAAIVYSLLIAAYLRWFEPVVMSRDGTERLSDLFGKLTYRHRYEALLERSGIDALTGVADRSRFEAIAQSSVARALAEQRPLSVAIVDVDHFKDINDRYGHVTGDDVLRRIAETLRKSVRASDQVFRYGGEEFVVLCEGMSHEVAMAHAERLRRSVPAALENTLAITPTVSIGVATAPTDGANILELIHHADLHLYEAKRLGRNRVVGNRPADRLNPALS
ncbi:GGDEF domain-containing protein [Flavisphingomonas formosensis]|uniref:GGDEF domain-containing protein n=1 Tax=Flavisphingomonas formosensis TaxID=861534 RepID=UPI001E29467D|nr:GGDEF domain-containing protein [Sphingomonas formosensis]